MWAKWSDNGHEGWWGLAGPARGSGAANRRRAGRATARQVNLLTYFWVGSWPLGQQSHSIFERWHSSLPTHLSKWSSTSQRVGKMHTSEIKRIKKMASPEFNRVCACMLYVNVFFIFTVLTQISVISTKYQHWPTLGASLGTAVGTCGALGTRWRAESRPNVAGHVSIIHSKSVQLEKNRHERRKEQRGGSRGDVLQCVYVIAIHLFRLYSRGNQGGCDMPPLGEWSMDFLFALNYDSLLLLRDHFSTNLNNNRAQIPNY